MVRYVLSNLKKSVQVCEGVAWRRVKVGVMALSNGAGMQIGPGMLITGVTCASAVIGNE